MSDTTQVPRQSSDYLERVRDVYARAAVEPDDALCCVDSVLRRLPGLVTPPRMLEMNYGCGSTVEPDDLLGDAPILYLGVGGGLEALQMAYFRRRPGGVIGVDPVPEMRAEAARNLQEAARVNPWFRPEYVSLLDGSAASLPVPDASIGVVAQNCLFNVLMKDDLRAALGEVRRVLEPGGRFVTSDPVTTRPLPEALRRNTTLRARCISGCVSLQEYLETVCEAGFGEVSVRALRPYRMLVPVEHPELSEPILLQSVDAVARVVAMPDGAPGLFTGRTATYVGSDEQFIDRSRFGFRRGIPVSVSDRTADRLSDRIDFHVTPSTYDVRSPGCC